MWCGMAHCCSRPRRKGEPAACEERPKCRGRRSLPASRPATIHPASQPESRQAKERRKEGWQLAVLLASQGAGERFTASFLHAPLFCRSVGRSMDLPRTTRRTNERTGGRTSMVTTHATAAAAKRKQVSFIQKPFSSRGPAAARELVAQGSYCHHYYSPLLVVVHCCCYSGW